MLNSPIPNDTNRDIVILGTIAISLVGVFLLDIATPPGFAIWAFYLLPTGLCLLQSRRSTPLIAAVPISVLLVAGFMLSSLTTAPGEPFGTGALNRFIGVTAVWALAFLVFRMIEARTELHHTAWVCEGEAKVHDCLVEDNDPGSLANKITTELCLYLGAAGGAMYSFDGEKLELIGGHAIGERILARSTLRVGEGISGEVVQHGRTAVLQGLPESYFELSSATGKANASALIAVSLTADNRICGMLELAFAGDKRWLSEVALRRGAGLLEEVSEAVGMSLRSAEMRQDLVDLLEETRSQGEELQAQQLKLQSSNDELEENGRRMRETGAQLERQRAELEQANSRLESQKDHLLETQRELQEKAAALEQASGFKSEFLANISHELRTPLNSALILARLLADNPDGRLGADQVRYAQTIHDANTDLLLLINDILDLSKVEAGKLELNLEPTPLETVLGSVIGMFEPIAAQRGLNFRVEIEGARGVVLNTDPKRLQQILRNLLSNAFKFTDRGEVELHVNLGIVGNIHFSVRDTGIGINPEHHAVIFEAFRQADGASSRRFGGTGLGLSISQNLAERLGGRLWVESTENRGSTFFLELPLDRAAHDAGENRSAIVLRNEDETVEDVELHPSDSDPDAAVTAKRVLVVGVGAELRDELRERLHTHGVQLLEAKTTVEALLIVEHAVPDCIVLDPGLPGTPGHTVLEAVAGRRPDAAPRIIAVTEQRLSGAAEASLRLQVDSFFIKESGAVGDIVEAITRQSEAGTTPGPHPEESRAIRARDEVLQGRVFLVADDDARNVFALISAFEPLGVRFEVARNGREAVDRVAEGGIELVLMDIMMPEMDGLEAIRQIRAQGGGMDIPVIALTAKMRADDRQACFDAGANDYLHKPVDLPRLVALCHSMLMGP